MFLFSRRATLGLILATAAITIISLSAQAGDPLTGTWELNPAKSNFGNVPAPQSQIRTYEVTGQQEKMIAKGIDSHGNPRVQQFSANRDGKDYPYEGWAMADTISVTPVDTLTATYTQKKEGKVVGGGTRVISKDGKTMTISFKGTDPKGQPMEFIVAFDKR